MIDRPHLGVDPTIPPSPPPSTGASKAPSDNALRECSSAVHPKKGLFPPLGALDFEVSFAPVDVTASNATLVLMLICMPHALLQTAAAVVRSSCVLQTQELAVYDCHTRVDGNRARVAHVHETTHGEVRER